ncbi:phosphotransferase family protein [Mycolicibacterium sp.]|uniref:phosphotransferase family protein n=1 Tax=Mycolicibacterium sp. TaxID=2320850 RepID=UPI001A255277|nr:phosphotransferase family protein [Mycolicibacterium sp.]MBJ7337549.1 phosphotransferase family protein [Mycolicibacterium sp.]
MSWAWSPDRLAGLGCLLAERGICRPEVSAVPVGDGHSNLTYLVSDGEHRVVVRRPPPPPVPAGAHDVVREARLVGALANTAVPVPRVLAVIEAGELLDVALVVTEFVDGVVITDTTPAPLDEPTTRRAIAHSVIDTLADLHAVDWRGCGLDDFGRPAGFNARHLRRVSALVADDSGKLPVQFADLAAWLEQHTPPESGAAIVHNDFRLGNMMVARDQPGRVAAVLDWELATIGDPLFDVGYFLSSYPVRGEPLTPTASMGTAVFEDGYPSRTELLTRYCERAGADLTDVAWYSTLAQFKLAALYEYGRRRAGTRDGDPYYSDPALVASFLRAGEALTT